MASGGGLLAGDAAPGAPLSTTITARSDYSGKVRPTLATVLYRAGDSPESAIVQASAGGGVAQFSLAVTAEGPLEPPSFLRSTANSDGSKLFEWDLPSSGVPAGAFVALLGRNSDGQWQTIALLAPTATSHAGSALELAPFTEFSLRVESPSGGNSSALSNVLGGAASRPSYAVIDLGQAEAEAVASDGTVILYRYPEYYYEDYDADYDGDYDEDGYGEQGYYRNRGGVKEFFGSGFSFGDMNDRGDIIGSDDTSCLVLATDRASVCTPWTPLPGSFLSCMNEAGVVFGSVRSSEQISYFEELTKGKSFISTSPQSFTLLSAFSSIYNKPSFEDPRYSWTGHDYYFVDMDNHGGAVGSDLNGVTGPDVPLYFGSAPRPSGDPAFSPGALNDDGLVLGFSMDLLKLWEPLANAFRTLAVPDLNAYYSLRISDPPAENPDAPTIILAANNIIYRTWKDADGEPSAFPIHTAVGASELLPAESGFEDVELVDISNNGLIVANANRQNDRYHAFLLLPVELEKVWSDQLPGVTDANYLPNKTGQRDRAYLLMGAAQSNNFDLKGHLKAKVKVPGAAELRNKILWRLAGKSGSTYIPENGTSTYNTNGDEVTITLDNPRTDDENSYYLVAGYDQDGNGQLSSAEAAVVPKYKWRHSVNGQIVMEDHDYEVKIVSRPTYDQSSQNLNGLANNWDNIGLNLSKRNLLAFRNAGTPEGATAQAITIARDEPGLTHSVGVLFQAPGNPGSSINAFFAANSEMTQAVLDSNKLYYWLADQFQVKREEVDQRFRGSENIVETFNWHFDGGDFEFERGPLTLGTVDPDLGFALGKTKISGVDVEVEVHRFLYTVESVRVTGAVTDLYDYDYDGQPQWPEWVRDAARVQAGYNTLGSGGRVYRSEVQMLNSRCERLEGNFEFQ